MHSPKRREMGKRIKIGNRMFRYWLNKAPKEEQKELIQAYEWRIAEMRRVQEHDIYEGKK